MRARAFALGQVAARAGAEQAATHRDVGHGLAGAGRGGAAVIRICILLLGLLGGASHGHNLQEALDCTTARGLEAAGSTWCQPRSALRSLSLCTGVTEATSKLQIAKACIAPVLGSTGSRGVRAWQSSMLLSSCNLCGSSADVLLQILGSP